MSQVTLSIRVNSEDKKKFEIKLDPFYSRENIERLEKSVQQLKDGNETASELMEGE